MAPPLLIADVPWLLYRSYFALPKSIADADGRPVNALLGTVNALLGADRLAAPGGGVRAVVACTGAEQADYRVELYPPYHAHRDPMPPELARQWEQAPGLLASLGWLDATSDELEADDVMFSFARVEEENGGRALLLTGDRDLYGAVERARGGARAAARAECTSSSGRPRCASATASSRRSCPTSSRCAATPPTGCPARPASARRRPPSCCARYGSLEDVLDAARARSAAEGPSRGRRDAPRTAASLRENDALLRDFKHIATLQRIDVAPPARSSDRLRRGRRRGRASSACAAWPSASQKLATA